MSGSTGLLLHPIALSDFLVSLGTAQVDWGKGGTFKISVIGFLVVGSRLGLNMGESWWFEYPRKWSFLDG